MSDQQQSAYDGWAILEIFGHQRFAGYVKTEYFGTACMFRLDVPPLEEHERVTKGGCYSDTGQWVPPGSTIKKGPTPGYSKLFGVGAIYALTPCDQQAALKAVEEIQRRPLMLVSLPPEKALTAAGTPVDVPPEAGFDCCSGDLVYGHAIGCPANDGGEDSEDEEGLS